jgi:hypothetical protein
MLQDPDKIPSYFAPLKMSRNEAVDYSRGILVTLGISLESVFADLEPEVTGPYKFGTNLVPYYFISWPKPVGSASVEIEINGNTKKFERISLQNIALNRPEPIISVSAAIDDRFQSQPQVNPAYARQLLPIVVKSVDEYARKLNLPIPRMLSTNQVACFTVSDNGGWPHSEIELTNGWRFIYRNCIVNGFYAPDNLFKNDTKPILIKNFMGDWRLNEADACALVRHSLAKLNYPTNHLHFDVEPQINKPMVKGIPRFQIFWYYNQNDDLQSMISAEVDADSGTLKALYYDDKNFWNKPPPVGLPLTLPRVLTTNTESQSPLLRRSQLNKHIQRPQAAFNQPIPK